MSIVKVHDGLDAKRVGPLTEKLMLVVKAHLEESPPRPPQPTEALNALAAVAAAVIHANEGTGLTFFHAAVQANIDDMALHFGQTVGHA